VIAQIEIVVSYGFFEFLYITLGFFEFHTDGKGQGNTIKMGYNYKNNYKNTSQRISVAMVRIVHISYPPPIIPHPFVSKGCGISFSRIDRKIPTQTYWH
jgi:hypothetical protein